MSELMNDVDMDCVEEFDSEAPTRKQSKPAKVLEAAYSKGRSNSKGKGRLRGKAGRLAFLLESPVEIVLEILAYLDPIDILNLSYIDKEMWAILTALSANSVWVAARKNVEGLPECPPDFTESAYARYLFLKVCELCGGIALGMKALPFIRVRLCGHCAEKHCIDGRSAARCLGNYMDKVELLPGDGLLFGSRRAKHYFRPSAMALLRRLEGMANTEERLQFEMTRKELIDQIVDHAKRLHTWINNTRTTTYHNSQAVREHRLESIRSRLVQLGHDRVDMESHDFYYHRLVTQNAELTERAWPNVRRQLEVIVEQNKSKRVKKLSMRNTAVMKKLLQDLFKAIPSGLLKQTFPPLPDLLELPSVRTITESDLTADGLTESFETQLHLICQEIYSFRCKMCTDLATLRSGHSYGGQPAPIPVDASLDEPEVLQLGSSVFCCVLPGCYEPLHYSSILGHPVGVTYARHADSFGYDSDAAESTPDLPASRRWQSYLSGLSVNTRSSSVMSIILQAVGLHDQFATLDDLNSLGPVFFLSRPDGTKSGSLVWQQVYRTLMRQHAGDSSLPSSNHPVNTNFELYSDLGWLDPKSGLSEQAFVSDPRNELSRADSLDDFLQSVVLH